MKSNYLREEEDDGSDLPSRVMATSLMSTPWAPPAGIAATDEVAAARTKRTNPKLFILKNILFTN
jgi:hypothetical protein